MKFNKLVVLSLLYAGSLPYFCQGCDGPLKKVHSVEKGSEIFLKYKNARQKKSSMLKL